MNPADGTSAPAVRTRLPDRRPHVAFSFQHGGIDYRCGFGWWPAGPQGRVAEIFLSTAKLGSDTDTNGRDASIAASLALQYGADLDTIRRALCRNGNSTASGALGVALDHVARIIASENAHQAVENPII